MCRRVLPQLPGRSLRASTWLDRLHAINGAGQLRPQARVKFTSTAAIFRPRSPKRYFVLLFTVLGLTVLAPLVEHFSFGRVIVGTFAIVSLAASVIAAKASRTMTIIAFLFAAFTGLLWTLSLASGKYSLIPFSLQSGAYLFTMVFVALIISMMLKDIFSNEVTGNRVAGAICVYFLGGFFFAMTHMTVLLYDHQAYKDTSGDQIQSGSGELSAATVYPLFVYYSFCTLSTAGYGDIVPVSHIARKMSWLEAVSGQIYLTVLLARLVGLHIATSTSISTSTSIVAAAPVSAGPPVVAEPE